MKPLKLTDIHNQEISLEISDIKEIAPYARREKLYTHIKTSEGKEIIVQEDYDELMDMIDDERNRPKFFA